MTNQWRIRVYGKPKSTPDMALLTQVVLLLSEQLQREQREQQVGQDEIGPSPKSEAA